jgi:hypothetical protein
LGLNPCRNATEIVDHVSSRLVRLVAEMSRTRNIMIFLRSTIGSTIFLVLLTACGIRRSSEAVRTQLLIETRLGASKSAVRQEAQREHRPIRSASVVTDVSESAVRKPRASSYLKIYLGHYRTPVRVDVVAYYIFDSTDRLIDVVVMKEADSL